MYLFDVSTDSTGDLKKPYREERNIWFVPLTFTMEKNGTIEESLDDFQTEEEYFAFYEKVSDGYFPRTAKLNYEAHVAHFTKMAEAGVKDVLHFMISSGLADTINITKQAAADVKKQYPDFNVYAVDPLTATVGQGILAEIAADCRDKGMTAQETFDFLNINYSFENNVLTIDTSEAKPFYYEKTENSPEVIGESQIDYLLVDKVFVDGEETKITFPYISGHFDATNYGRAEAKPYVCNGKVYINGSFISWLYEKEDGV